MRYFSVLAQIFHLSLPKIWQADPSMNYFSEKYIRLIIIPESFKALAVILKLWQALEPLVIFGRFLSKGNPTRVSSSTLPVFLPLIDSPNGLPKLKFVESTVFEIMEGGGGGGGESAQPPSFMEGVGTKYLCTGRVKVPKLIPYFWPIFSNFQSEPDCLSVKSLIDSFKVIVFDVLI